MSDLRNVPRELLERFARECLTQTDGDGNNYCDAKRDLLAAPAPAEGQRQLTEADGTHARADALLLCAHPIVARSRDQGLRRAIAYHLGQRPVGFEDREPEPEPDERRAQEQGEAPPLGSRSFVEYTCPDCHPTNRAWKCERHQHFAESPAPPTELERHVGFTCDEIHEMWESQRDRAIDAEIELTRLRTALGEIRAVLERDIHDAAYDYRRMGADIRAALAKAGF
jgi:hypothetical protein